MITARAKQALRAGLSAGALRFQRNLSVAPSSSATLPSEARVVVVGGGVIGCSIAYHLAKKTDGVVLVERDQLTSGTTWHAAGLMVTYGSLSETSTNIRKYSKQLYEDLEHETGQSTGLNKCGFIELAVNKDRLEEYRRVAAFNRKCGVDVQEISAAEVESLFPLARTDDVLAGFYVPDDGRVNPVDLTMALAKGAKMAGAELISGVVVDRVLEDEGKVTGVATDRGVIKAPIVVNCAGMWARQLAQKNGVCVPNQAAEHYYLITEAMPEVNPAWPVIEDPQNYTYIRPEAGGLMVGLFEGQAAAWNTSEIPNNLSFTEITPDWDRMAPYLEAAMSRVPATLEVGAKNFFCGPESFVPDLNPVVGESPEIRNYFVCAGLNSIGILSAGGLGRLMADWIVEGYPKDDITAMHIDRCQPFQSTQQYRAERVVESLGMVYKCHYPNHLMQTGRGVKHMPLHHVWKEHGACFRDVTGWEAPWWFAGKNNSPELGKLTFGKPDWFEIWKSEHEACRQSVALFDMSFMGKNRVTGPDAGKVLNLLSTANVDGKSNMITYTQWLNTQGTMEADLTVIKHSNKDFTVVASDNAQRHCHTMIRRMIEDTKANASVFDVTGSLAMLSVQGPKARDLIEAVSGQTISDEELPFRACKQLTIGYAEVLCARITYVGELGYELYVPSELAVHVARKLLDNQSVHVQPAGLAALGSLRMEKAYRDYGHDMDNTDTIVMAGLRWNCDMEKENGFVGKDAVSKMPPQGKSQQRLVQIVLEDPSPMMYHGEIVYRNGQVVGDVRAASFGHTLGAAVGLAMVDAGEGAFANATWVREGQWEVDIAGRLYQAKASVSTLLDPKNLRPKGVY